MAIEQKGDFVLIQKTTIRISEILAAKPQSMVSMDYNGKILNRDFPKIILTTNQGSQQFLYPLGGDEERDADLRILQEIIGSYQTKTNTDKGHTTINVTSSTGVNIVSNSTNVNISQEKAIEAKGILTEMKIELNKLADINNELKEDIEAIITEIENQVSTNITPKRHTFRSLLGITSDFASLAGLSVSLGQVLGYL